MGSAIELDRATKIYKDKTAVNELSLRLEQGSVVALLGPNGAGKSTTVNMMLGLLAPTSGSVRLLDGSPQDASVRNRIGAMLQEVSVIDGLKVEETIELFRSYYAKPIATERLLALSGLAGERGKFASALSGGQKRRLGFALALAGDPEVIFLDEPTVGMDITSRQLFWETIRSFAGGGRTIVLTTHYLEEADGIADRVVVIDKGRLVADGTLQDIKMRAGLQYVSFTAGPTVSTERLQALPGVTDVRWSGRRVRLYGTSTDALLFALIRGELDISDIETHKGGLEDAFQALVGSPESAEGSV
jgi:ABC-2 type transport system ATP-binding protein